MKLIITALLLLHITNGLTNEAQPIQILNFKPSECQNEFDIESGATYNDRIISLDWNGDTLRIQLGLYLNCGSGEIGHIELVNDTLHISHSGEGIPVLDELGDTVKFIVEEASCNCCFQFEYVIRGLIEKEYVFWTKNKQINISSEKLLAKQNPEFAFYQGDTINIVDRYGMRQGVFISFNPDGSTRTKINYKNGMMITTTSYRYYDSGELKEIFYFDNNDDGYSYEFNLIGDTIKKCKVVDFFEKECE